MTTVQNRAAEFAQQYAHRPIPAQGPIDTSPIDTTPDTAEYNAIWQQVIAETRARGNDFHLPISVAYARRLCDAYPQADRELVLVSTLLHDTGWAHVDEDRIISEGFRGDWRTSDIRFEHERQGCIVAGRVLPGLGYSQEFIDSVCAIIDGHDTRAEAHSLEDAIMRDADRSWRFDRVGIALASGWFDQTPDFYTDRLEAEIIPELNTQAAIEMARADLARSRALMKTTVIR